MQDITSPGDTERYILERLESLEEAVNRAASRAQKTHLRPSEGDLHNQVVLRTKRGWVSYKADVTIGWLDKAYGLTGSSVAVLSDTDFGISFNSRTVADGEHIRNWAEAEVWRYWRRSCYPSEISNPQQEAEMRTFPYLQAR